LAGCPLPGWGPSESGSGDWLVYKLDAAGRDMHVHVTTDPPRDTVFAFSMPMNMGI